MLIVILTGVIVTACNIVLGIPTVQTILTSLFTLIATAAYLYSMKTRTYRKPAYLTTLNFFVLLAVSWFATYGSRGSVAYYFFIFVTYSVVFFSKNIRLFIGSVILYIVGLLLIENRFPDLLVNYDSPFQQSLDIGMSLILCLLINILVIHSIYREYLREREMKDNLLRQALLDKEEIETMYREIKILQGCLPICASCKKIRDEKGDWNQIEKYLSEHSEAKLSHGVCPECVARLYPELKPGSTQR